MQEIAPKKICTVCSPTVHLRCGRQCDPARVKAQSRRKYAFTDQIDQLIREAYLSSRDAKSRPSVRLLAKRVGMPHWALKKRARELGLARTKEFPWSDQSWRFWPGMRG